VSVSLQAKLVSKYEEGGMSYDADYEKVYMVQFESGRTIYVDFFDIEEVKEYCAYKYKDEVIKAIYEEVYVKDAEEEV
jgi:hypothetical protein